jgi:hypothetical protein
VLKIENVSALEFSFIHKLTSIIDSMGYINWWHQERIWSLSSTFFCWTWSKHSCKVIVKHHLLVLIWRFIDHDGHFKW